MCTYRWTIIDTGIGMSQDFLQHIFEPFAQEKSDARSAYQGAGLGMPIVKGLLDQMGGTIDITSEVGVGSTFVYRDSVRDRACAGGPSGERGPQQRAISAACTCSWPRTTT